ncbi:MAG: MBL fold metallo-hydrolase [Nitrospira sp. SG-bin1]|nr:MAG: MBL fold metallo-hydrolase [Nitrospira sp. SG-bin1]
MTQSQTIETPLPSLGGSPDIRQGSIQFIGTATVLIRYAGFTVLTDPNFLHRGEYVHLGYGLRSRRLTEPALALTDLPPIDLVLLSHLHEDHFDRRVERDLDHTVPIVTTRPAAAALGKKGFRRTIGLETWAKTSFVRDNRRLTIAGMPGRHGPWLISRLLPPVMGSMLEFMEADRVLLRLYISGDTLLYGRLEEVVRRYTSIDQALIHLGGTRVLGLLVTMDGAQGVGLLKLLRPTVAIPIHFNDYTVFKSPLSDFQAEVRQANLDTEIRYLHHGDSYVFETPVSGEHPMKPAR